jgi:hypothetical protein
MTAKEWMDISTKKYTIRGLLFPLVTWITVIGMISTVQRVWKPQPCLTVNSVSRFYGPGVYWAWVLTLVSASVAMIANKRENQIPFDFIAACVYTLGAMVDVQFRLYTSPDIKTDFQSQAALHIIYVALLWSSLSFIIGQWIYEMEEHDPYKWINVLSGPWTLKAWAPFMLVTIIEALSIMHRTPGPFGEAVVADLGTLVLTACFLYMPSAPGKLLLRLLLYGLLDVLVGQQQRTESYSWPTSTPHTGSNILDTDQLIGFTITFILLVIHWKAWSHVSRWMKFLKN